MGGVQGRRRWTEKDRNEVYGSRVRSRRREEGRRFTLRGKPAQTLQAILV